MRSLCVTKVVSATDTDILNDTILQSIPTTGTLIVEASTNDCDDSNGFLLNIQTPEGFVPIANQQIPAGSPGNSGGADPALVLDNRTEVLYEFPAQEGGHFQIGLTEKGTAIAIVRITLVFQ